MKEKKYLKRNQRNAQRKNIPKKEGKVVKVYEENDKFGPTKPISTDHHNDWQWYAHNEQMLKDAASFSYNNPLGSIYPGVTMYNSSLTLTRANGANRVPGLMANYVALGIGPSSAASSPANLAAQNVYAYVRYMNSGAKNYDAPDLFLYLMAMDSLYACWSWMKRMYGLLASYSQLNKYMPRSYFIANCLNIDDFVENIADFRAFINQVAAQISSFCVPATMTLFIRHSWMFSNVYKDSESLKAQQYIFVPAGFYQYDETSDPNGGSLIMKPWGQGFTTETNVLQSFGQLRSYVQELINAVSYSEDIGIMSGDILKAYGRENLFKLDPLSADYGVQPVYDEKVLNQIHNSTCQAALMSSGVLDPSWNITQNVNSGFLIYQPKFASTQITLKSAFINMPWDDVTPANTMVGTRMTALLQANQGNFALAYTFGSELIVGRKMYVLEDNITIPNAITMFSLANNYLSTGAVDYMQRIGIISQFDWHPLIGLFEKSSNTAATYVGMLGDINNYTIIDAQQLENMNLTALLSEFNVPQLGSF